jgi:flagellar motor switch protein FliM
MSATDALPSSAPPRNKSSDAVSQRGRAWLPIIQTQRRHTLWQLHQQLAAEWSQRMRDFLHHNDQFTFGGMRFETFGDLAAHDSELPSAAVFASEANRLTGLLMLNPGLSRYLVDRRLGAKPKNEDGRAASFTQLEYYVLRSALDELLASVGATYGTAGLGSIKPMRRGIALGDMQLFTPDIYLIEFHYRVAEPQDGLVLTLATNVELLNAVKDAPTAIRRAENPAVRQALAAAPLNVEVVLGTWNATIDELRNLRAGDEIILPDGAEAWLSAGGIRLGSVTVKMEQGRLSLQPYKGHPVRA